MEFSKISEVASATLELRGGGKTPPEGEKVLYVGSSISCHCDFDVLGNETGAEVRDHIQNQNVCFFI